MHLSVPERLPALKRLFDLLKPGGGLALTIRLGTPDSDRGFYPVSAEEFVDLAKRLGFRIQQHDTTADQMGREKVTWAQFLLLRPACGSA